ncbi:hypothetical protein ACFWIA_27825 [Streptomyces sp. NPDC127068]|uniref:hypothetical protein n=1 Tax=Streptomyces sp. NPDC127068 TaxID=3347127 RepID=UPI003650DA73
MSIADQFLTEVQKASEPRRRPFDVAMGLRRLAEEAGYTRPTKELSPTSRARHQLTLISRWTLNLPSAATHLKCLADEIANVPPGGSPPGGDLDIDGIQIYAAMLHLADHSESAQFWWQLAAGADHGAATYSLHLLHLSRGETREATFWQDQLRHHISDDFLQGLDQFVAYVGRHDPPGSPAAVATTSLEVEFDRLSARSRLVFLPGRELADRLHCFAIRN